MIASRPIPLNQSQKPTTVGSKVQLNQGNKTAAVQSKTTGPASRNDMVDLSSDDDSEAESVNRKRSAEEKDDKDNNEPVEQLLKTKKARSRPFSDDLLVSPNGLEKIYFEFPLYYKYSVVRHGTSTTAEGDFLKRILTGYKEWAFQLHPGVSFTDAVGKCEVLGSKSRVRNYMMKMRDKERDRYMNDVLLPIARKQAEFIEFESRKAKLLEEQNRKEVENAAAAAAAAASLKSMSRSASPKHFDKFEDLPSNTKNTLMNQEEDDEWDIFDEKLERKPINVELPTQIDEIPDELLLSIENDAFVTQDTNHTATQGEEIIQKDSENLQDDELIVEKTKTQQKVVAEEDIFGEDSDDDLALSRKTILPTHSQLESTDPQISTSEEAETYPQDQFF